MTHEAGIEAAARAVAIKMQLQDFGSEDNKGDFICTVDQIERLEFQSALAAEAAIQAYLSASGMVLVPRKATDEMKFHTLVAGYLAVGSEGDEALSLAKDKMNTEGYDEFSDAQYAAMLDAAPNPFKSKLGQ